MVPSIYREIFAMRKLISSKVKFFYIRARFLNGRRYVDFYRNTNYNFKMVRGCEAWKLFVPQVEKISIPDTQPIPKSNIFQIIWQKFKKGRKELILISIFLSGNYQETAGSSKGISNSKPDWPQVRSGILADFWVPHEIDSWNFQHMLDYWFFEASQNLSSFRVA